MAQRLIISIPDEHYNWLQEVKKRRGWEKIQDAIRSLIEDAYRLEKEVCKEICPEQGQSQS